MVVDWHSGSEMVYLKSFILALGSFFLPVKPLLLLVGLFICTDTILGIWAAHKRGEKINSRKLGNIIPKMILYQSAVLIGYVLDVLLLGEFINYFINIELFITKIIAMVLVFVEALSINENFENITGKNLFNSAKLMITRGVKVKHEISKFKDDETA
jgi:hypothetical protein